MNSELAAVLQRTMRLTDDELAAVLDDEEQLQSLLDVVFVDSPDLHLTVTVPSTGVPSL